MMRRPMAFVVALALTIVGFQLTDVTTARAAAPPVARSLPTVTGSGAIGSTLDCQDAAFTFSGPVDIINGPYASTYSTWYTVEGVLANVGATFEVPARFAGQRLVCRTTGSDSAGTTTIDSAVMGIESAPATFAEGFSINMIGGDQPSCGYSAFSPQVSTYNPPFVGGDITVVYGWLSNGVPIAGARSKVLDGFVAPDARVSCTITISNALGSASVTSTSVWVRPTLIVATGTPRVVGSARPGATLQCVGGSFDRPAGWTILHEWTDVKTGRLLARTEASTLYIGGSQRGHQIACAVEAASSGIYVRTPRSAPVTIAVTPPVLELRSKQRSMRLGNALSSGVATVVYADMINCSTRSVLQVSASVGRTIGLLSSASKRTTPLTVGTSRAKVGFAEHRSVATFTTAARSAMRIHGAPLTVRHVVTVTCAGRSTQLARSVALTR